jgi:hypothetical protein
MSRTKSVKFLDTLPMAFRIARVRWSNSMRSGDSFAVGPASADDFSGMVFSRDSIILVSKL